MLLKDFKIKFINQLSLIYDVEEVNSLFYISLEQINKVKRIDLALNPNIVLTDDECVKWNKVLEELEIQKPIQYIFKNSHFYGLEFFVSPSVLIPRQETEELVEWIIKDNTLNNPSIIDIGTGSGCIAISLAKNIKTAQVFAIDISIDALEIAKHNAAKNKVIVSFIETNILTAKSLPLKYNVIVSNPPYVRNLEKHEIKPNVLEFEPHLALFVEDTDALLFYRKIAELAKNHLEKNGKLYFEINQYLALEMQDLLINMGFVDVQLKKDIHNNNRMIVGTLK